MLYRDYSQVQDDGSNDRSRRKLFPTFLHEFISDPQNSHIVTWLPHGRSFIILRRDLIELNITKPYFKLTNAKSFIRQLNGYGFHRIKEGTEKGSYFHEVTIEFG